MAETADADISEAKPIGECPEKNKVADMGHLAFTIQFNDRKIDGNRQLKIHERLSAFALKHRRNPSLPDFGILKNAKTNSPIDKVSSPLNSHNVPILNKATNDLDCLDSKKRDNKTILNENSENHSSKTSQSKLNSLMLWESSILPNINGVTENFSTYLRKGRRSSLNDVDKCKSSCRDMPIKVEFKLIKNSIEKHDVNDLENKSDTVSEAGTYTVDKDEGQVKDFSKSQTFEKNEESEEDLEIIKENSNFHHKWINDWVCKVAEQNFLHPVESVAVNFKSSGSGNSSPGRSKIPSPVNTLGRLKGRQLSEEKPLVKVNGNFHHRRSSSLSLKDYNENRTSDVSLETESFLRTTESVMTAMQNRMKLSFDGRNSNLRKSDRRDYVFKEKPHPPSTASDTDTNSESDGKIFKKPLGNPFTSARLNRAFSLRRAKAEPENEDSSKKKPQTGKDGEVKKALGVTRSTPSPNLARSKPPLIAPFSRTDCGRFSMRSTSTVPKCIQQSSNQKKETKKSSSNGRSNSSLSSREVEFQNWKRRKSFDPMKSAAEGRKKELAKKAAMNNQGMTQSVNLGLGTRMRSGNPVLRSASFHSTPRVLGSDEDEQQDQREQVSTDDREESLSPSISNQPFLPRSSPTRPHSRNIFAPRSTTFSSRCSLSSVVSETHSSPSHRIRSEVLDNLVMTAINDLSYKLRLKSCNLLKKLDYVYEADEERSLRLREQIAILESRKDSNSNSPIHQTASRDLSGILKNLKSIENVLKILDDVLFDESLEIFIDH